MKFDDTKTEECEFHQYKSPILIKNIDINKIVISNRFTFGKQDFKYFIGCKDNKKIRPLCIFFLEISAHKRYFNKSKCMYFIIKDEKIFDKYMTVWEKVRNTIKANLNSELICNKKYPKTEERFSRKESFYIPEILFDSVYRKDENC